MNAKKMMAFAAVAAVSVAMIGCGGNDCEDAADRITSKFEECGIDIPSEGEGEGECTDEAGAAAQQFADCVEAADCEVLDGSSMDPDAIQEYTDCISG